MALVPDECQTQVHTTFRLIIIRSRRVSFDWQRHAIGEPRRHKENIFRRPFGRHIPLISRVFERRQRAHHEARDATRLTRPPCWPVQIY